jgi:SPP1 gp7 family putative phage head morphogenesis protein
MPKNKNSYWTERARKDKLKVIKTGEQGIDNLKRLLLLNLKDVEAKIKDFYEQYGENPAEELSNKNWQQYKKRLRDLAKANPQDKTLQKLAKQNIPKYKIDRLRALELDLQMQLTEATNGQAKGIYNTLDDVSKVSQATLASRMDKTLGLTFNAISANKMKQILMSDWSGANWSERLWKDREKVGKKLTEVLEKGIPQGVSLQKMSRELRDLTGESFNNAFRLIRTETSHIDGQVTLEGYKQAGKELGLEYYEYDAFLDTRTSSICRELNGNRFKVSEAEVGVNYPPMHPNCRSTTQLVLDEDYKQEEDVEEIKKSSIDDFREIEINATKEVEKINTTKEIANEISSLGEFLHTVDLDDIPKDVANELFIATKKVFNKYPQLKGGSSIKVEPLDSDVYADNMSFITAIHLNSRLFKSKDILIKSWNRDVELGFHPINTTFRGIIIHEFGHSLHSYIELNYGKKPADIKRDVLKIAGIKKGSKEIKEKLSEYATRNPKEFFAEAFTEYLESPNPRKIAKTFGEYIDKILKN